MRVSWMESNNLCMGAGKHQARVDCGIQGLHIYRTCGE